MRHLHYFTYCVRYTVAEFCLSSQELPYKNKNKNNFQLIDRDACGENWCPVLQINIVRNCDSVPLIYCTYKNVSPTTRTLYVEEGTTATTQLNKKIGVQYSTKKL